MYGIGPLARKKKVLAAMRANRFQESDVHVDQRQTRVGRETLSVTGESRCPSLPYVHLPAARCTFTYIHILSVSALLTRIMHNKHHSRVQFQIYNTPTFQPISLPSLLYTSVCLSICLSVCMFVSFSLFCLPDFVSVSPAPCLCFCLPDCVSISPAPCLFVSVSLILCLSP